MKQGFSPKDAINVTNLYIYKNVKNIYVYTRLNNKLEIKTKYLDSAKLLNTRRPKMFKKLYFIKKPKHLMGTAIISFLSSNVQIV